MTATLETTGADNIGETIIRLIEEKTDLNFAHPFPMDDVSRDLNNPLLISVPSGRKVEDFTQKLRDAQSLLKPFIRKGHAQMQDLASLIAWANRFKGDNSVLYATNSGDNPKLTCIADYHFSGAQEITPMGDPSARHAQHRATYAFPLSKQWKAWMVQSGKAINGQEMGVFLEDNILDVIDPPLSITSPGIAGAEADDSILRLIDIARRLEGSYGNGSQLLGMAQSFGVYETSDFVESRNTTTGEATLQHKSEHVDGTGQPIRVPKLFLIAIPVFENGPPYRLPVRFQYRKNGASVKFILTLHDPKHSLDHAFTEATTEAAEKTKLPLFLGTPES